MQTTYFKIIFNKFFIKGGDINEDQKNDNGKVREFEIKEFVEKLVAKEAIKNTDKIYYCENPQKLCEELNSNEKQFGIKYDVV